MMAKITNEDFSNFFEMVELVMDMEIDKVADMEVDMEAD